jgi:hypothetical protein
VVEVNVAYSVARVQNLSASLRSRIGMLSPQRYDVRRCNGDWLVRSWRPINVAVLDHNGEIVSIITLDSARAEIAIARRYERATASANRLKRAARRKANRTAIFATRALGTLSPARHFMAA